MQHPWFMPMKRTFALVLALLLVLPPPAAFAWWDLGHIQINRVALAKLPADVPAFLRNAADAVAYLGPEPDRWRVTSLEFALSKSQAPDHFLNMEMLEGLGPLPEDRFQFYRLLNEKRLKDQAAGIKPPGGEELYPEVVGTQPYIMMEVYGRLKAAFREYRHALRDQKPTAPIEATIIQYAGWLGHYVGDAAQPLHTTIHYNGWVGANPHAFTTDKQTHGNFEGVFVQNNIDRLQFDGLVHAPARLDHPFADYQKFLRDSNALVVPLYELEKAGGFRDKGTPEGVEFVRQRLAAGAQMLANVWYTAWLESAVEPPPRPPQTPPPPAKPAAPPAGR